MGHLEGNFTPVLYMGRKVHKGLRDVCFTGHVASIRFVYLISVGTLDRKNLFDNWVR